MTRPPPLPLCSAAAVVASGGEEAVLAEWDLPRIFGTWTATRSSDTHCSTPFPSALRRLVYRSATRTRTRGPLCLIRPSSPLTQVGVGRGPTRQRLPPRLCQILFRNSNRTSLRLLRVMASESAAPMTFTRHRRLLVRPHPHRQCSIPTPTRPLSCNSRLRT